MAFKFEKLDVWHLSLDYTDEIYEITNNFPKSEVYGLSSQLRNAANSVVLNIAEGSTTGSDREFKRFLNIAARSGIEVVAGLYIAKRRQYILQEIFEDKYKKSEQLVKKIFALRNSLK